MLQYTFQILLVFPILNSSIPHFPYLSRKPSYIFFISLSIFMTSNIMTVSQCYRYSMLRQWEQDSRKRLILCRPQLVFSLPSAPSGGGGGGGGGGVEGAGATVTAAAASVTLVIRSSGNSTWSASCCTCFYTKSSTKLRLVHN